MGGLCRTVDCTGWSCTDTAIGEETESSIHLSKQCSRWIFPTWGQHSVRHQMQEISDMATAIRARIPTLKVKAKTTTDDFQAEVNNSHTNIDKVTSMTQELKTANQEVEQMLGQSGRNFTPAGSVDTLGPPDINGVRVNKVK